MSSFGLKPRESQQSKVTSTPCSGSPASSQSPSVSSIGNEEVLMEADSQNSEEDVPMEVDSGSSGEEVSVNESKEESTSLSDESVILKKSRKRRKKQLVWPKTLLMLKPKTKNSLFFKLIEQPNETESIAIDYVNIYSHSKKEGIILILQLFVDLSGFKKVSLHKIYNFDNRNAKEVVEKLGSDLLENELKESGKFIFKKSSRFTSIIESIVTDFLEFVITKCFEREILFDVIFTNHIFDFLSLMIRSSISCIRVTGAFLIMKLLTCFLELYHKLIPHLDSQNNKDQEQKATIETSIDFLNLILDKNCLLSDKKCCAMRIKYPYELVKWIRLFPEAFIFKRKSLGRLMKLLLDNDEKVRNSALNACGKLVTCDEISTHLENRIELCLKIVSSRILDINFKVASKAVAVFTGAIRKYSNYITREYKMQIIYRMFEENFILAKAAGLFFATYLQHQTEDNKRVVILSAKLLVSKKEFAERVPFFLESCFEFLPQFEDWDLIIGILLDKEVGFQLRKQLVHIFYECVMFTLIGRFSNNRQISKGFRQKSDDHISIISALIPKFESLVVEFQTDKVCKKEFVDMLTLINYKYDTHGNFYEHYLSIINLLKDLFGANSDTQLLEKISKAFSCLCEKLSYVNTSTAVDTIKKNLIGKFNDCMEKLASKPNKQLLVDLRDATMKISILFENFDLTNVLRWVDIFQVWGDAYFRVLKYLIVCCKSYLVWSFRQFLAAASNNGPTNQMLHSYCKDFIYCCLEMLKNLNHQSESFLIFETLCDLYISFEKELKRKRQFDNFIIKISEPLYQDILVNFVTWNVILNTNLPLHQRQKYLSKLISVMALRIIPLEYFSKILRFYNSHFNEFSSIMNNLIKDLNDCHPALPLIIIHTLAQLYEEILEKHKVGNLISKEAQRLKSLSKKLADVKELKSSNVLKLINMCLIYAFKKQQNYSFLYFVRYFARNLNADSKSEAYQMFRRCVTEDAHKDNVVLEFAAILKSN